MPWVALGIAAASAIGSYAAQSSANDRASMLQNKGLQQWLDINIPDPAQLQIVLQKFVNQGQLDPVLQKAIQQDPTGFNQVTNDPKLIAAQNKALSQLQDIGNRGGLRLQDKAAIQDATLAQSARDRGANEAISANMAQRGIGGSGFELQSKLASQQSGQDSNATNSLKVAADAQQRALQAIEQGGSLAGQLRTQDYQQQADRARAQDSINQFNTANLQNVNAQNAAIQNYAQERNLNNAQDISNRNTQVANQQQIYNKSIPEQQFQDRASLAAGKTGQYNQLGKTEQIGGELLGNTISNVGGAGAGAATSYANNQFWQDYFDKLNKNKAASSGVQFPGSSPEDYK